ncbi:hypothetical protein PG994_015070 [Apiospora phragmitis]|uniref:Uncharacterized protein n=1 Tax=Apiospora phragmitis TaxID=2905665 RepID=A0ABR1SVG3_9PEZI
MGFAPDECEKTLEILKAHEMSNFHETLPCDTSMNHPDVETRYTVTSFISHKPPKDGSGPDT